MRWAPVLMCLLLLAPPIVQAAHEHDHRYIVAGRVLDAEGLPAGEVGLRVELTGTETSIPAQATRTQCNGDFLTVFKVEEVAGATVEVEVQGRQIQEQVEPTARRTFLKINTSAPSPAGSCQSARQAFDQQHVVTGRLLTADGDPREGARVTVRLPMPGGQALQGNGTTNQAGDFAVAFQSPRLENATHANISAAGETWQAPLDHTYRITVADHTLPGGDAVRPLLALVLVAAALGGLGFFIYQRRT